MEGVIDVEDHTSSSGRLVSGMLGFGELWFLQNTLQSTSHRRAGKALLLSSFFFLCIALPPFFFALRLEEGRNGSSISRDQSLNK
jgi:hypothetical protein